MPRTDHPAYHRLTEDYAQALQAVADAEATAGRLPELRQAAETIFQMLRAVNPEEAAPPWRTVAPSQARLALPDPPAPAPASWSPDWGRTARPAIPPVGGPHLRGEQWNRAQTRHIVATLKATSPDTYAQALNDLCGMYGASAAAIVGVTYRAGLNKKSRRGGKRHPWQPGEIAAIRERVQPIAHSGQKLVPNAGIFVTLGREFGVTAKAIYNQWHLIERRLEEQA